MHTHTHHANPPPSHTHKHTHARARTHTYTHTKTPTHTDTHVQPVAAFVEAGPRLRYSKEFSTCSVGLIVGDCKCFL